MSLMWARILVIGLLLVLPAVTRAEGDLQADVQALIGTADYRGSRWGILAIDARTGAICLERNPDTLFVPASVTKLFTCAACLIALGPNSRIETPIYRRGTVEEGTLTGDLLLVAQGDLTLGGRADGAGGLAFTAHDHSYANWLHAGAELTAGDPLAGLRSLAHQVRASGIERVTGDLLIDVRLFPPAQGTGSGPTLLSPMVVNDNAIDFIFTPGKEIGALALLEQRPASDFYQVESHVHTGPPRMTPNVTVEQLARRFVLRGEVPLGGGPIVRIGAVDDPPGFARSLLLDCLRREGVTVAAGSAGHLPAIAAVAKLPRVAVLTSAPFCEVVKVTLKTSNNLYGSTLPLLLGAHVGKTALFQGIRSQGPYLADLGVDVSSIALESGAGGAAGDRVTPRATVQLLRGMLKRPEAVAFEASLPILGVDGTLAGAVGADHPLRGRVRAKTGTLGDSDQLNGRMLLRSKSMAGYLTTQTGRRLIFAIFVNDVPLPRDAGPERVDKTVLGLCELLHRQLR